MQLRRWSQRAIGILLHDLTLVALVCMLVAVGAGVMAAAIREVGPADLVDEVANALAPSAPETAFDGAFEEDLASNELAPTFAPLPPIEEPVGRVVSGTLARGESLARALAKQDVPASTVHVIDRELRPIFDFRRARPGHGFRVMLDEDDALVAFDYEISPLEGFTIAREGGAWHASRREAALEPQVARIAGLVTSSLHDAIVQLGERGSLAHDFAEIFAWDVDFSRAVRSGDEFRILYERLYHTDDHGNSVYVRPGRILAARYTGAAGDYSAVYFEPAAGRGGYYRPDGSSVVGQFLRAPLRYSRISSSFTHARRHPILKITRPHHGIDYAAPAGTPLWSVADGTVIYRGWAGGFGNLVKVRHRNGYVSYYAHLSRFASGLSVGQSIDQKQVVGYVGSSGLATGPHVCFRIAKDGRYVNPASLHGSAAPPVPPELDDVFASAREMLLTELDGGALVSVEEAL